MRPKNTDYKNIPGWGIDADPKNEPTWPMRTRTEHDNDGYTWERPTQQPVTMEILHSNERPNFSAVYGTSSPPSGLSGMLRRYAFKFSESSYGHWLPLLLADRVNVYEGIIDDLKRGYIPNFFAERGWKAEWKYNRKGVISTLAISGAVVTGVAALLIWNGTRKKKVKNYRY